MRYIDLWGHTHKVYGLMYIMQLTRQSYFLLSFIFIEMKFYLSSFLCDVCIEVHEHMQ